MENVRTTLTKSVISAATRGNRLARWLVRRETRKFLQSLPPQSQVIKGPFLIPDPNIPLPDDADCGPIPESDRTELPRARVDAAGLVGRFVVDASLALGSYGTGGYGFLGLDLGEEWLVVPILGAGDWVLLDGRILQDSTQVIPSWIEQGDDRAFLSRVCGGRVTAASIGRHAFSLRLDNGAVLEVDPEPDRRPRFKGTGAMRGFLPDDDLTTAIFLSPSPDIYV